MGHDDVFSALQNRGISRRDFLKYCSVTAALLGLSTSYVPRIAHALETRKKPILVLISGQTCTGDTEALLRASKPTVDELILDVLSLDYSETIMAAAGKQAEKSLRDVLKTHKGNYFAAVEGSIPLKDDGVYCCVAGRSVADTVREVCGSAIATFALGTCASFGGIPHADPNPTGAVGVRDVVPNATVVNLSGCPVNVENLTATIVHYLTFGSLPLLDALGRPLFAYGKRIHDNCERRAHFDAGQYVRQWGDEGHRLGWCLYYMGCKGPQAYQNCPTMKYNEGTSWPVQSGHGCIACAAPDFWDQMTPFYRRLPQPFGVTVETTADKVGLAVASATVGGILVHTAARLLKGKIKAKEESKAEKKTEGKGSEWHE